MPFTRLDGDGQDPASQSVKKTLEATAEFQFHILSKLGIRQGDTAAVHHSIFVSGWRLEDPSHKEEFIKTLLGVIQQVGEIE